MAMPDASEFPVPNNVLAVGDIAYDTQSKSLGVLMAEYGTLYFLRPLGGGREWDTPKTKVRPATPTDHP
ncbi:hypothetical protein GCM10010387_03560 [Streptomyces inusitatus]|uniref:Uncharacterized protein n=1 Tax=Streptomyces inusitatus TaxID=68221 RepID=A0A918PN81_9ACTN|nr:hypothetical protein [Streptomyces inusitatus]GGZ14686.1 hypothetical protein GCM10010387_03560 [Streptomyces inusitatus]